MMAKILLLQGIKCQNANKRTTKILLLQGINCGKNNGQDFAFVGNQVPKYKLRK